MNEKNVVVSRYGTTGYGIQAMLTWSVEFDPYGEELGDVGSIWRGVDGSLDFKLPIR